MNRIPRPGLMGAIERAVSRYPVTLLLGPRQCGKTTVARELHGEQPGAYFDLEDPDNPLRPETAKLALQDLRGLVVIDEFHRQPELFPLLRVLADRRPSPARFLVLGSASLELVRGVSESLAGRVAFVEMSGFGLDEVGAEQLTQLWVRGGFPEAFLAEDDEASFVWRSHFMRSFLERDVPQLGIRVPANTLRRFWLMLAHVHGQVWNAAELARSLMTKEDMARRYLDILAGTFMVRQIPPWFENIGKRLVKSSKVFIRDSGILHALLGLRDRGQVQTHPKLGLSWEGFALDQVVQMASAEHDAYFYKTHGGAELDLLLMRGGKRYGFEFKYADAPRATKSMHVVIEDLGIQRLFVIYPGGNNYPLTETIEVVPLQLARAKLKREGIITR